MKHINNLRDFGGYAAVHGAKVKKGILYRSGHLDKLSKKIDKRFEDAKINTIIDLRGEKEFKKNKRLLTDATRVNLPIDFDNSVRQKIKPLLYKKNAGPRISEIILESYAELVLECGHIVRSVFDILLKRSNYPILIHCRAGKDRTGFISAIILLAMGVDEDTITEDYLETNKHFLPEIRKQFIRYKLISLGLINTSNLEIIVTADEKYIRMIFKIISDKYGDIEKYLESCGVSSAELEKVRDIILE